MIVQNFSELKYKNLANDQLIAYAILSIKRQRDECTFERLVRECFVLFPKSFGFYRYPEWPDSIKLDRPLRDLRHKRLVSGSNQTKFNLTGLGERYALEIEKSLTGGTSFKKATLILGRREKRLLDAIGNSDEFQTYLRVGEKLHINILTLKKLFFGTMETPKAVVVKNIEHLLTIAKEGNRLELLDFLNFCKQKINE